MCAPDSTSKDLAIINRLKSDYAFMSCMYDVVGVFLFGSQNYETDTETSDIDIKTIVMPKADQLLLGKGEIKETHQRCNGELTVFDIASMHHSIKKSNINFLEILFTEYRIINPKYRDLWFHMITMREDIAYHNKRAAMECIYGCAMNKFDKLFKPVPSNKDRIEHTGYDYKAWSDILRFWYMMQYYKEHCPYANVLKLKSLDANVHKHICDIKNLSYVCVLEQLKEDAACMRQNMEVFMNNYREQQSDTANESVIEIIDDITLECLKAYMNERCYKERWPVLSC